MPEIRNRIIDYGIKNADQFTANPRNPRVHPQFQRDVMKAALDSLGWIAPVIENRRTGFLVDGHERIMQALVNNDPVPYVVVDLDESEEAEALATFDPITGLATYDVGQLDALLQEVNSDNPAMQAMLNGLASRAGLYEMPNAMDEWQGMPEYDNEPRAFRTLYVHFKDEKDFDEFCNLIEQKISVGIRSIWFPKSEPFNSNRLRFENES